ncbi:MAG: dihydropteroate synthase [Flavobacteriaceae bacterium]|nr:dihydropteroate synthase [Flavobacteriaceae bacterium]
MGILNITPDSFYDGGKYDDHTAILHQVEKMLYEGATFIDVGAYSSRPRAIDITEEEELSRILPVIDLLVQHFDDILLSTDTFRSTVAKRSVEAGVCMVNDISGGLLDEHMFATIAELQVPYILMHMAGTPQSMQKNPVYKDVVHELIYFFSNKVAELRALKVNDIILDVGFGFGKSIEHNYELLKNLSFFKPLDLPLLVGLSRKSMLYKLLDTKPGHALNATTSAHTIALLNGANILRVHDVKEAIEAIKIVEATR